MMSLSLFGNSSRAANSSLKTVAPPEAPKEAPRSASPDPWVDLEEQMLAERQKEEKKKTDEKRHKVAMRHLGTEEQWLVNFIGRSTVDGEKKRAKLRLLNLRKEKSDLEEKWRLHEEGIDVSSDEEAAGAAGDDKGPQAAVDSCVLRLSTAAGALAALESSPEEQKDAEQEATPIENSDEIKRDERDDKDDEETKLCGAEEETTETGERRDEPRPVSTGGGELPEGDGQMAKTTLEDEASTNDVAQLKMQFAALSEWFGKMGRQLDALTDEVQELKKKNCNLLNEAEAAEASSETSKIVELSTKLDKMGENLAKVETEVFGSSSSVPAKGGQTSGKKRATTTLCFSFNI